MRMNQFGYDESAPNPSWLMRDQLCKCEVCGCTWVGVKNIVCSDCSSKGGLNVVEGDSNANPK